ncbi:uncharacterized protein BDZ99DRAFT_257262 [Mytilinidion resinicola]|uniref:Extracellular membrane protein CFEM domain-containing protein n=1 Tax=Mytilinidion resinicola TaxID=574789 RepID=A0A6A6YXG5_9PEZI|nr:uncharacterized protein BDZ99DRAFT_257262 [Mytilinidion resinicola]KAF2813480.1 hypothetical protein BDZ99DRAFT_257262 [Mytilinidion resinicola]
MHAGSRGDACLSAHQNTGACCTALKPVCRVATCGIQPHFSLSLFFCLFRQLWSFVLCLYFTFQPRTVCPHWNLGSALSVRVEARAKMLLSIISAFAFLASVSADFGLVDSLPKCWRSCVAETNLNCDGWDLPSSKGTFLTDTVSCARSDCNSEDWDVQLFLGPLEMLCNTVHQPIPSSIIKSVENCATQTASPKAKSTAKPASEKHHHTDKSQDYITSTYTSTITETRTDSQGSTVARLWCQRVRWIAVPPRPPRRQGRSRQSRRSHRRKARRRPGRRITAARSRICRRRRARGRGRGGLRCLGCYLRYFDVRCAE